ncbi:uncharacterized protein PAC_02936 [Phialocephala subalpina]|uniref:Uncharacterized protein n=1 Tax=Phialocephala subalpina TaxID=576137 RepID=A0A1L7WJW8_9HELO|nr:uncharacterized protein PAC_02936 [Phialocephala subalpina]
MATNGEPSNRDNLRANIFATGNDVLPFDISKLKISKIGECSVIDGILGINVSLEAESLADEWFKDPAFQVIEDPNLKAGLVYQFKLCAQLSVLVSLMPQGIDALANAFKVPPTHDNVQKAANLIKSMDNFAKEFFALCKSADYWMPKKLKSHFWRHYREERYAVEQSRRVLKRRSQNATIWAMERCSNLRNFVLGESEYGLLGWELLHSHAEGVVVPDTPAPKRKKKPRKKSSMEGKSKEKASAEDVSAEKKKESRKESEKAWAENIQEEKKTKSKKGKEKTSDEVVPGEKKH